MKQTDVKFLAESCNGKILGKTDAYVCDVKIDSREAKAGDMFVCVVGEKNDGHNFIKSAYDAGCRVFLVSKETEVLDGATYILAKDTQLAFRDMAKAYLDQFDLIKVGVTGSVGKTTTKMLTAAVLSAKYNTVCTQKNYNSFLGTCITAFSIDDNVKACVFEMGMDTKGDIDSYISWVRPDSAVVTNIGISHLERLGSRDAIADEKLSITKYFSEENLLVVNAQSDYLGSDEEIRNRIENKKNFKILKVGKDIVISDVVNKAEGGIEFCVDGEKYALPLLGNHNAIDAALAITIGKRYGIDHDAAAKALMNVTATDRRLKAELLSDILLLDDSYNASPDSMKAGISALVALNAKRKIAVLGDMFELGSEDENGHIEVGRFAAENGVKLLIAVGDKKDYYSKGVLKAKNGNCNCILLENLDSVISTVCDILKPGDAVLVKASNAAKLNTVASAIREKFGNEKHD